MTNNRVKMLSNKIAHHARRLSNISESNFNEYVEPVLLYSDLLKKEAADVSIKKYSQSVKTNRFLDKIETLLEAEEPSIPGTPPPAEKKQHPLLALLGAAKSKELGLDRMPESEQSALLKSIQAKMNKPPKMMKGGSLGGSGAKKKIKKFGPDEGDRKLQAPTGTLQAPDKPMYYKPGGGRTAGYTDLLDTGEIRPHGTDDPISASVGLKQTDNERILYGPNGPVGRMVNGKPVLDKPNEGFMIEPGKRPTASAIEGYLVTFDEIVDKNNTRRRAVIFRTKHEVENKDQHSHKEYTGDDGEVRRIPYPDKLAEHEKYTVPHFDPELERVRLRAVRYKGVLERAGYRNVKVVLKREKTPNEVGKAFKPNSQLPEDPRSSPTVA